jgi:hypothetical protein
VDGRHLVTPPIWNYDEFRWREVLQRPLVDVDDAGKVIVGRSFTTSRCRADARVFGEFTDPFCRMYAGPGDAERQPFAYTTFGADGAREGTRMFQPEGLDEFLVFDMAVRGEALAIVGSAVKPDAGGQSPLYPAEPGDEPTMVQYDAYAAVLERSTGAPRFERYVDGGRGDLFAAVRWASDGFVAGGAAGWDRWYGGMSISRGGEPLVAFISQDGSALHTRTAPSNAPARHHHLLSIDVAADGVVAGGLSDAPLTHSGDEDSSQLTFGGLSLVLR